MHDGAKAGRKGAVKFFRFTFSIFLIVGLTLTYACTAHAGLMNPIPGDPIKIDGGKISGTKLESGAHAYFGIPYAMPPIRDLRWHAPVPVKPWKGVYNSDTRMPGCITNDSLADSNGASYHGEEARSEDCLYLNMWVPAGTKPNSRLPVMVWIHGGGFRSLIANNPSYGGQEFVKKGVIYLTIEYRTWVFGFLAHPDLTRETGYGSGDWGLLDQVAALKWIQRNIAAFGGNPRNVTVMGESAGSMSVSDLMVSPLSKGLFVRAIGMSGTFMPTGGEPHQSLKEAEAMGVMLQGAMKAKSLDQMRGLSWDKLKSLAQQTKAFFWPDIDGYYMPDRPENIFAAGKQHDVPLLSTSTGNDLRSNAPMGQIKTLSEYKSLASQQYGSDSARFLELWPASNDAEAVAQGIQVNSNTGFGLAARDWARRQTMSGKQPVYLALFARIEPLAPGATHDMAGSPANSAAHASDVVYWMHTLDLKNAFMTTRDWSPLDYKLSEAMHEIIINFAKTGNPSSGDIKVPRYDPNNEQRLVLGDTIFIQQLNTASLDFLQGHPVSIGFGSTPAGASDRRP